MIDTKELIGLSFQAFKDCCQRYKGEAKVIRQKKNGCFECEGINGELFEQTKTELLRRISSTDRNKLSNVLYEEVDGVRV